MTSSAKPPPATDPRPQPDKFCDLARELGCDEDEAAFEATVRGVAHSQATEYRVDWAKRGPGFTAQPVDGAGALGLPIFPTMQEVRDWLAANGYVMINGDHDRWTAAQSDG